MHENCCSAEKQTTTLSAKKSGRQDLNLSPQNHNQLQLKNLQENQKAVLPKNCQNTAVAQTENTTFEHELQEIISVWPSLDADTRRQIMELARKGGGK
ncbi:MAG: hypothetical protein BWY65_02304 [Firmicutes bacterium ADurb.Bin373]|nr:MAG: hypothetical protein BWY65_02304 [Firmicutes bacterium ADurb.Bin373]